MNTYYEGQKVERFLKHTLDFVYARTILGLLDGEVKENCYGCEVDHPSQVQHTCLMWSKAEQLDAYFDIIFQKIKYEYIVMVLRKEVEIMDIPTDYKNNVLNQFEEWCDKHKPNAEHIWITTERVFSLENRFGEECEY